MSAGRHAATADLFGEAPRAVEPLAPGAMVLRGFVGAAAPDLAAEIDRVAALAPFRIMTTPGGRRMSVAMTNCGAAGWVTDKAGYRYAKTDPATGRPWPSMPPAFSALAARAAARAGYAAFDPDSCLINRYAPGSKLSLHQDRDERNFDAPIVSVSLGLPAIFLFGGATRAGRPRRVRLQSGDVVVWGGPARLVFHGVAPLAGGDHPLTGRCRLNLTLRKAF